MDVRTETVELYRKLYELGWEVKPATPKKVQGNLIYSVKMKGPAGQSIERTGVSEQWALVNALHFAQRQNQLRGSSLQNTLPTHQPIPGIRYNKAIKATERDVNHDWRSPYASEFNDEMRAKAPTHEQIPSVIVDHVKETTNAIDTAWYLSQDVTVWRQAVMNAFRAALLSPRKDFKWNTVHYQDIADMPHDVNSGDMFRRLETRRQAWNGVFRGDPLIHVRYKKQLKKLEKYIQERDPSLKQDDVRGIALGVVGKLLSNAEKFYVAHVMKDPKRFRDGEWVKPPNSTKVISKAQDLLMGQLDLSLGDAPDMQGSVFTDENEKPLSSHAQQALQVGLQSVNLEDYVQEARGEYKLGSSSSPTEEDLGRARNGQKTIKENYGAFIYNHFDAIEGVGQNIDELTQYAHDDITKYGGSGHYFRNQSLNLGILGTNPKVMSLTWLLLSPKTSQLGTIDTHMARLLTGSPETGTHMPGNSDITAGSPHHYYNMERQLAALRDRSGLSHIPLGQYQWMAWDWARQGGGDVEPGSDHRGMRVSDPTFYGDIDWPVTKKKQIGPGQVNHFHPPDWMLDAYEGRKEVAQEYVDSYGGYSISDRPEPDRPKPPKTDKRYKMHQLWGLPLPQMEQAREPVLAGAWVGDMDDVMFPLLHGHHDDYEPETEDWIPYEAEDDAIHHANVSPLKGYAYGQEKAAMCSEQEFRHLCLRLAGDHADGKKFLRDAMRGYEDGIRTSEDREIEGSASRRTQEAIEGLVYPSSYDLTKIAMGLGIVSNFEAFDLALEDTVMTQRTAGSRDAFKLAAELARAIQKVTGHDALALLTCVAFLEENGYPYAAEVIDDVALADSIEGMRVARVNIAGLQGFLEDQVGDSGERKPSFRFVFYKGVLDIRDYDHNLRYRNMIRDVLNSFGKNIEDQDVMDQEIASGDVYQNEGNIDIELESLADNDVQTHAVNAIHRWAEGVNLIGPVGVY